MLNLLVIFTFFCAAIAVAQIPSGNLLSIDIGVCDIAVTQIINPVDLQVTVKAGEFPNDTNTYTLMVKLKGPDGTVMEYNIPISYVPDVTAAELPAWILNSPLRDWYIVNTGRLLENIRLNVPSSTTKPIAAWHLDDPLRFYNTYQYNGTAWVRLVVTGLANPTDVVVDETYNFSASGTVRRFQNFLPQCPDPNVSWSVVSPKINELGLNVDTSSVYNILLMAYRSLYPQWIKLVKTYWDTIEKIDKAKVDQEAYKKARIKYQELSDSHITYGYGSTPERTRIYISAAPNPPATPAVPPVGWIALGAVRYLYQNELQINPNISSQGTKAYNHMPGGTIVSKVSVNGSQQLDGNHFVGGKWNGGGMQLSGKILRWGEADVPASGAEVPTQSIINSPITNTENFPPHSGPSATSGISVHN